MNKFVIMILALSMFMIACSRNKELILTGYWKVDSMSYKERNFFLERNKTILTRSDDIVFTKKGLYHLPFYNGEDLNYLENIQNKITDKQEIFRAYDGNYFLFENHEGKSKIYFYPSYPFLQDTYNLTFYNDVRKKHFLVEIKNKDFYLRAIRQNFNYNQGIRLVNKYQVWEDK